MKLATLIRELEEMAKVLSPTNTDVVIITPNNAVQDISLVSFNSTVPAIALKAMRRR